jgi:hypothetical protein
MLLAVRKPAVGAACGEFWPGWKRAMIPRCDFPDLPRRLSDSYRFPGFRPLQTVVGFFGDPHRRIIRLVRRSKKRRVASAGGCTEASTIGSCAGFAISRAVGCGSSWRSKCVALRAAAAAR